MTNDPATVLDGSTAITRTETATACAGCLLPGEARAGDGWPLRTRHQSEAPGVLLAAGDTTEPVSLGVSGPVHACVIGTPVWTDRALAQEAQQHGHARALVIAWQRCGEDLLEHLSGAFGVMLADAGQRTVLLATDLFASVPLVFAPIGQEGIAFASSVGALRLHPRLTATIDPQALYDFLYFHVIPAPRTIYHGMTRLRAAQRLLWRPEGSDVRRYWHPQFPSHSSSRGEALGAALRERLSSAVHDALSGADRTSACFLSGGLDSSTVTGMYAHRLQRLEGTAPRAFTIGFAADGFDEMEYARLAARHFGVTLRERYITPDEVAEALPLVAAWYDEPFGNSSAVPAFLCARTAAQEGVTRLLAGDGGDEIFAGNERYVRQKLFDYYGRLPGAVRTALRLALGLSREGSSSPLQRLPGISKAVSYVAQARMDLPARIDSYNFLVRYGAEQIVSRELLAQVDTGAPAALVGGLLDEAPTDDLLQRMLYLDWQLTLADNDLRKVSGMCAATGLEVRYPMLDPAVLELSLQVPAARLLPGHRLRHFYKQALGGFLPQEIIDKRKHGFGLPFGIWLGESARLREVVYPALDAAARRGIVRAGFIDQMRAAHRDGHAYYFGNMLWIIVVLELWLQSHGE